MFLPPRPTIRPLRRRDRNLDRRLQHSLTPAWRSCQTIRIPQVLPKLFAHRRDVSNDQITSISLRTWFVVVPPTQSFMQGRSPRTTNRCFGLGSSSGCGVQESESWLGGVWWNLRQSTPKLPVRIFPFFFTPRVSDLVLIALQSMGNGHPSQSQ